MHLMIDIETLSTSPNAAVASIGIAAFDMEGIHEVHYTRVDWQADSAAGGDVEPGTVAWWLAQSEEARKELTAKGRRAPKLACEWLNDIVKNVEPGNVWANGPEFDLVILSQMFKRYGMNFPVPFWKWQSLRTAKLFGPDPQSIEYPTELVGHNALDDAVKQAIYVIAAFGQKTGQTRKTA